MDQSFKSERKKIYSIQGDHQQSFSEITYEEKFDSSSQAIYMMPIFDNNLKMDFEETKANREILINLIKKEQLSELVIEALISPYIKKEKI